MGMWDYLESRGAGWSRSYPDLCSELHWMTLEQRRRFLIHCQMYKILHAWSALSLATILLRSHPYSVIIPQSCTNVFRYSFFVNAPHLWHVLEPNLVQTSSLNAFRSTLFNFLIS